MAKKKRRSEKLRDLPSDFHLPAMFGPGMMEGIMRDVLRDAVPGDEPRANTPLERAQELLDRAYRADRPEKQIALARRALHVSPDCADAFLLLADHADTPEEDRELCRQAVAAGQRAIGQDLFQASVGHFWGVLETRPYMRARLRLARLLWEAGEREPAIEHYREMLRLNPGDNQGVRYLLLSALMDLDRDLEAGRLLEQYVGDISAEWVYTSALLAFRKNGDSEETRRLLHCANDANSHVPEYLAGNRPLPDETPEYIGMGDENEAISYVGQFLPNWRNTAGAVPWMRKTLRLPLPRAPKPRKPAWPRFRNTFLRLPQVEGEVWQVNACGLPVSPDEIGARRPPWALLVVSAHDEEILAFEVSETKPATGEVWNALVETLLRPRAGEAHRPQRIEVRRKTFYAAWRKKLAEIGVECVLSGRLDVLDELVETLTPPPGVLRRMAGDGGATEDGPQPDELIQEFGETWQADVRRLPSWIEHDGEMQRPWAVLVANRDERLILAQGIRVDPPTPEWLWEQLLLAMRDPLIGEPHRPGVVEVGSEDHEQALRERLEAAGITCLVAEPLEQIDEIFQQLARHFAGGKPAPALMEVPGMRLEQAGSFYRAAADFYRAAPWRKIPGDVPLKIECEKFQTGTWYAVVIGQSGMVLGLALYEDFDTLQAILAGHGSDEENSRRTTGLSVMYGEAFEIPITDLDAIEKHGWPVAGPEAYPGPVRVNPGRSVRPPLAWELELLEGCLRAVPQLLAENAAGLEMLLPVAGGELKLRVSRMQKV